MTRRRSWHVGHVAHTMLATKEPLNAYLISQPITFPTSPLILEHAPKMEIRFPGKPIIKAVRTSLCKILFLFGLQLHTQECMIRGLN